MCRHGWPCHDPETDTPLPAQNTMPIVPAVGMEPNHQCTVCIWHNNTYTAGYTYDSRLLTPKLRRPCEAAPIVSSRMAWTKYNESVQDVAKSVFCVCPPDVVTHINRFWRAIRRGSIPVGFSTRIDSPFASATEHGCAMVNAHHEYIDTMPIVLTSILSNPAELLALQQSLTHIQHVILPEPGIYTVWTAHMFWKELTEGSAYLHHYAVSQTYDTEDHKQPQAQHPSLTRCADGFSCWAIRLLMITGLAAHQWSILCSGGSGIGAGWTEPCAWITYNLVLFARHVARLKCSWQIWYMVMTQHDCITNVEMIMSAWKATQEDTQWVRQGYMRCVEMHCCLECTQPHHHSVWNRLGVINDGHHISSISTRVSDHCIDHQAQLCMMVPTSLQLEKSWCHKWHHSTLPHTKHVDDILLCRSHLTGTVNQQHCTSSHHKKRQQTYHVVL